MCCCLWHLPRKPHASRRVWEPWDSQSLEQHGTCSSHGPFPASCSSCWLLDCFMDCVHLAGSHKPPPRGLLGLPLAEVQRDPSSMGVTGRILCVLWSRKSHQSLNLLFLVVVYADGELSKMGVGMLKGKKCESQASDFSFALARGR